MLGTPKIIMTYKFKNIIARKLNKSIKLALSSQNTKPDYYKIFEEHNSYLNILKKIGLKINLLEPLENYPDSIFVEDNAIIYNLNCIILKPFHHSRKGECKVIKNEIKKYFKKILFVERGTIEGGDVLNINNHFIIGLSNRTDKIGAQSLSILLKSLGASVKICQTPKNILHFKSECSLIDENTILVSERMAKLDYLKSNFNLIKLPKGDEVAANSLRINNQMLIPDGFAKTEEILSKKYNIIKIKVNEISKIDAGLSCMSLRW